MGILIRHAVHADVATLPLAAAASDRGTQRTEGQYSSTKDRGLAPSSNIRISRDDKITACRTLLVAVISLAVLCMYPARLVAQDHLEISGGYVHSSGDQGLNGYNVGLGWWFSHRIEILAQYENLWNTSTLGLFQLTVGGQVSAHSFLQNGLIGPRVYFPLHNHKKLTPLAELQIGGAGLRQRVQQINVGSRSVSGSSFSWILGGGLDYAFNDHWSARGELDFFRTHFANTGQSRWRLPLGVAYTFGKR
jgi:opacity protein-like surface antigen